jgi:hypothetical protein
VAALGRFSECEPTNFSVGADTNVLISAWCCGDALQKLAFAFDCPRFDAPGKLGHRRWVVALDSRLKRLFRHPCDADRGYRLIA